METFVALFEWLCLWWEWEWLCGGTTEKDIHFAHCCFPIAPVQAYAKKLDDFIPCRLLLSYCLPVACILEGRACCVGLLVIICMMFCIELLGTMLLASWWIAIIINFVTLFCILFLVSGASQVRWWCCGCKGVVDWCKNGWMVAHWRSTWCHCHCQKIVVVVCWCHLCKETTLLFCSFIIW